MAAVVVYPFKKLRTAFPVRHAAAMMGEPGAIARKVPIVAILAPSSELFTRCRGPGILMGLEDMRPASLRKATTEPVKVTPPMDVSYEIYSLCHISVHTDQHAQVASYEVQRGNIANISHHASKTRQHSSQTDHRVQGRNCLWQVSSRGPATDQEPYPNVSTNALEHLPSSLLLYNLPKIPPIPATPANCISTAGGKPTAASDARIPELTPNIPRIFPCRAVAWEANPDKEPMHRRLLARYPACTRPAMPVEAAAR